MIEKRPDVLFCNQEDPEEQVRTSLSMMCNFLSQLKFMPDGRSMLKSCFPVHRELDLIIAGTGVVDTERQSI
jgi:hypothetical protein